MRFFALLLYFLPLLTYSQEAFSFKLYFEDANGNRDTLVLGYDPSATDSVDLAFGEENIISQPWDSVFDVRITNHYERSFQGNNATFHLKKAIQKESADPYYPANKVEIDIKSIHFPISVRCDSTELAATKHKGTFLTSMIPGGWFDTGGFVERLFYKPSVTIDLDRSFDWGYYPFNEIYQVESDTVFVAWANIADSSTLFAGITDKTLEESIEIVPNPSNEKVSIVTSDPIIQSLVYDCKGEIVMTSTSKTIDVQHLKEGVYFVKIYLSNGIYVKKLIKN